MIPGVLADIAVHDANGQYVAAVEVKNRADLNPRLAAILRRNMAFHGQLPHAKFFLLISQDRGFLWVEGQNGSPEAEPAYEFSMRDIVEHYLPRGAGDRLRGAELHMIVLEWLSRLANPDDGSPFVPDRALVESGFADAIRGGAVMAEYLDQ